MTTIAPLTQNSKLVDRLGFISTEFKIFIDQVLSRIGGITGGNLSQLTDGATIIWDVDQKPVAFLVLGGSRFIANPANMVAGLMYRLTIFQDATGGRTLSWGSAYKFPGGSAPTLSTAANAVDELWFTSDGTNMRLITGALNIR